MKDAVNYFIPIVEDPMNDITGRCITHHASTNGYYGYQPVIGKERSGGRQQQENQEAAERMETSCDVDIQFNNCMEPEELAETQPQQPQSGRKRVWDYDADLPDCKKRRENEPLPFIPQQPPVNKSAHIRQPTHNIPDMPRCMMDVLNSYKMKTNLSNTTVNPNNTKDVESEVLEELLLREIHGSCSYHWLGHDI